MCIDSAAPTARNTHKSRGNEHYDGNPEKASGGRDLAPTVTPPQM